MGSIIASLRTFVLALVGAFIYVAMMSVALSFIWNHVMGDTFGIQKISNLDAMMIIAFIVVAKWVLRIKL